MKPKDVARDIGILWFGLWVLGDDPKNMEPGPSWDAICSIYEMPNPTGKELKKPEPCELWEAGKEHIRFLRNDFALMEYSVKKPDFQCAWKGGKLCRISLPKGEQED